MRNLDLLVPQKQPKKDWWTWATVTQADPLRIRLDGELVALDMTPDNLAGPLTVDQRVWVQVSGRRLIVTGVSGGPAAGGDTTPAGVINPFAGTVSPEGWLLCKGAEISRSTYADLYAVTGDTFGAGDGSTTFNLPDLEGRFPWGAGYDTDASGLLRALGSTGGDVKLGVEHLPAHDHGAGTFAADMAGQHQHTIRRAGDTGSHSDRVAQGGSNSAGNPDTFAAGDHTHTISGTSGQTGGDGKYLPPYLALNWIIKF